MTQEEIENKIWRLQQKISVNEMESNDFRKQIQELNVTAYHLDDPHALIPNQYKSLEEWLNGHPFPSAVHGMCFKNKRVARNVQLSCNTYQSDFHIVRVKKNEN